MRSLGVSYPTAWLIKHKVMQSMAEREALYTLDGRAEVDAASVSAAPATMAPRPLLCLLP